MFNLSAVDNRRLFVLNRVLNPGTGCSGFGLILIRIEVDRKCAQRFFSGHTCSQNETHSCCYNIQHTLDSDRLCIDPHQRSKNANGLLVTHIAHVDTISMELSILYFKRSEFQMKCTSVP